LIEEIKSMKNLGYNEFLEEIRNCMKKGDRILVKKYSNNFDKEIANIYLVRVDKDLGFTFFIASDFIKIYLV
jgi:hypothetical protein